jgi:hypothetical protein
MQASAIPIKTALGRQALRRPGFAGTRAQRALLIMVDGCTPIGRLEPVMYRMGLSQRDVQDLATAGYLGWVGASAPAAPGNAAAQQFHRRSPLRVPADLAPLDLEL